MSLLSALAYFIYQNILLFFSQDSLQQKDERIEELEEALRESVQITAEREMVLAQEESARSHAEKQVTISQKHSVNELTYGSYFYGLHIVICYL